MPWENKSGGGGPWGQGPSGGGGRGGGGGGSQPPDLEELLKRGQERMRQVLPSGNIGKGGIVGAVVALFVVWAATGIYTVATDEQGIVMRFGQFVERTSPGLNYHLPWPIETVYTPKVTRENQIAIGFRPDPQGGTRVGDSIEESLMLTGDENIVDIDFTVVWVIKDAAEYLFNVQDPDSAVKAVAESAMREIIGRNQNQKILTELRGQIQDDVRKLMQTTLDAYQAGVTILRVQLQKVDPPAQVLEAFRDVQAAKADLEKIRNEALSYANRVVPEARGQAAKIVQDAEGYKAQVVAEAQGEAARFLSIYAEYKLARGVTRDRIYIETMERVLGRMNKIIVDGEGAIPFLPLDRMMTGQPPATAPAGAGTGGR